MLGVRLVTPSITELRAVEWLSCHISSESCRNNPARPDGHVGGRSGHVCRPADQSEQINPATQLRSYEQNESTNSGINLSFPVIGFLSPSWPALSSPEPSASVMRTLVLSECSNAGPVVVSEQCDANVFRRRADRV